MNRNVVILSGVLLSSFIVDVFPTICSAIGVEIPAGVQGRSLWALLTGEYYPEDEVNSTI